MYTTQWKKKKYVYKSTAEKMKKTHAMHL